MSPVQAHLRTPKGTGVLPFVRSHRPRMRLRPDWRFWATSRLPSPYVGSPRGTGVLHFIERYGLSMALQPDWPCSGSLRTPVPLRLAQ